MLNILKFPIIQAPMAGGVSTPALAAAVSNAGGLGFLAAGYKTTGELKKDIEDFRQQSLGLFGVNLFVPSYDEIQEVQLISYQMQLEKEAARLGVPVGEAKVNDDEWEGKLALVKKERVPIVSFTFGCPSKEMIDELKNCGIFVIVTVTNLVEARQAVHAGADALCLQGIEAGGHRASFTNNNDTFEEYPLLTLIQLIKQELDIPLIAAGGIMNGQAIADVLAAGAVAAQLGTAFLLCAESGTNLTYRHALMDNRFFTTRITRAFTGRRARGLVNYFLATYDEVAPAAYPQVHYMTQNIRKAATQSNNPDYMSLWAGVGFKLAEAVSAEELILKLAMQVNQAKG